MAEREQVLEAKRLEVLQVLLDIDRQKAMSQFATNTLNLQEKTVFVLLLAGLVKKLE